MKNFRQFLEVSIISIALFIVILFIKIYFFNTQLNNKIDKIIHVDTTHYILVTPPPSLELYYKIHKYAPMYDIPIEYAYGTARIETGWMGPLHFEYNHKQISHAGAMGPMQIMPATARGLWPDWEYDEETLLKDIDFNVHCSMKLLRENYDRWGNWKIVFGAYNTGRPIVNDYAHFVYNYNIYREWDWKTRKAHRFLLVHATTNDTYENYN